MRFLILFLFLSNLYSCALCALFTPTAHVNVKFSSKNEVINELNIEWIFSENFTKLMLESYDFNGNMQLENREIQEIERALKDYIVPRNYLMKLSFYDKNDNAKELDFAEKKTEIFMKNGRLYFKFLFEIELEMVAERIIRLLLNDDEKYFNFMISNNGNIQISSKFSVQANPNLNISFYKISEIPLENLTKITDSDTSANLENSKILLINDENITQKQQDELSKIDEIDSAKISNLSSASFDLLGKLKAMFKNENSPLFSVILVAFLYGFFHAAGPGHGKILTASYFASSQKNYKKAASFALKIGVLHVIGAYFFVNLSFFIIEKIALKSLSETSKITTNLAGILIICVAIFMIYDKLKKRVNAEPHSDNCECSACKNAQKLARLNIKNTKISNKNLIKFQTTSNFDKNKKISPKNTSKINENLVILSASLVPCPGTIIAFALAFELGRFWLCGLSAVAMSLGMASVIFVAAVFGLGLNKNLQKWRFGLEILALFIILILGFLMIFDTKELVFA